MTITVPPDYNPKKDKDFMSPIMLEYFRRKLLNWRGELLDESNETLQSLQEGGIVEPDIADRASIETERALELRTRDRARKLISKIDEALKRIEDGSYGYCEETEEPISVQRLEARPIATLSIEAQERHERMERTHRDD
ncbi:MAG: RNA polymerase-binding protein DksA [Rhodospirillales bacterium]